MEPLWCLLLFIQSGGTVLTRAMKKINLAICLGQPIGWSYPDRSWVQAVSTQDRLHCHQGCNTSVHPSWLRWQQQGSLSCTINLIQLWRWEFLLWVGGRACLSKSFPTLASDDNKSRKLFYLSLQNLLHLYPWPIKLQCLLNISMTFQSSAICFGCNLDQDPWALPGHIT